MHPAEILPKLIGHYKFVLNKCKKAGNLPESLDICLWENCYMGICHCALSEFGEMIADEDWMQGTMKTYLNYWFTPVHASRSFDNLIQNLEYRIRVMEDLLKKHETVPV